MKNTSSSLSEAEIQLLIALIELEHPIETPNNTHYTFYPKTIEEAATYFRGLMCDWQDAYPILENQGYLRFTQDIPSLTTNGKIIANQWRSLRPPIYYWYRDFYKRIDHSPVYARFCEQLYGKNLCQAGFSDMEQVDAIGELLKSNHSSLVLDLGCGNGMASEYLSEYCDASFVAIDYTPEAIESALARTVMKREKLNFQVDNFDTMCFPKNYFDGIISIDTLYMPYDLEVTLHTLTDFLKPGGIFTASYMSFISDSKADRSELLAANTPLGKCLTSLSIPFEVQDFSCQTYNMMQRKYQLAEHFKSEFLNEGNEMLYTFIIAESLSQQDPYNPDTCPLSRYLYYFRKPE